MGLLGKFKTASKLARAMAAPRNWSAAKRALLANENVRPAECSCCGHVGKFASFGFTNRPGAQCPRCGSLERHRLLALAVQRGAVVLDGKKILHFAPEKIVSEMIGKLRSASYETADIDPGRAMVALNIEAIDRPDDSVDLVICSHVLEHVDDRKALAEMFRILKAGGELIVMVPLIEGWPATYEDAGVTSRLDRVHHFGHTDHVRFYGADLRDRIEEAGYMLAEFTPDGADCVRFGLARGEKVFTATKPG